MRSNPLSMSLYEVIQVLLKYMYFLNYFRNQHENSPISTFPHVFEQIEERTFTTNCGLAVDPGGLPGELIGRAATKLSRSTACTGHGDIGT